MSFPVEIKSWEGQSRQTLKADKDWNTYFILVKWAQVHLVKVWKEANFSSQDHL
jgi:hypothetical protein